MARRSSGTSCPSSGSAPRRAEGPEPFGSGPFGGIVPRRRTLASTSPPGIITNPCGDLLRGGGLVHRDRRERPRLEARLDRTRDLCRRLERGGHASPGERAGFVVSPSDRIRVPTASAAATMTIANSMIQTASGCSPSSSERLDPGGHRPRLPSVRPGHRRPGGRGVRCRVPPVGRDRGHVHASMPPDPSSSLGSVDEARPTDGAPPRARPRSSGPPR